MAQKMHVLTRIDPLMAGKVNAVFGLVGGLVMGLLILISSGIVSGYLQAQGVDPQLISTTQQYGFLGLIFFLVTGVIWGFIMGAVGAVIYNAVVKLVGGIQVEWDEE